MTLSKTVPLGPVSLSQLAPGNYQAVSATDPAISLAISSESSKDGKWQGTRILLKQPSSTAGSVGYSVMLQVRAPRGQQGALADMLTQFLSLLTHSTGTYNDVGTNFAHGVVVGER